jgi:DNA-directed RNA polymerase subunit omega
MARITVEDCLKRVDNMYELVILATQRAQQIYRGSEPMLESKNRVIVTALREIAAGYVTAVKGEDGVPISKNDDDGALPH